MKKYLRSFLLHSSFSILILACSQQKIPMDTPVAPLATENSKSSEVKIDMAKCTCVQLWMPVCGENEKTYSNACFAKCAGVKFKQGSCTKIIKD